MIMLENIFRNDVYNFEKYFKYITIKFEYFVLILKFFQSFRIFDLFPSELNILIDILLSHFQINLNFDFYKN
jgi:hypothetical protein